MTASPNRFHPFVQFVQRSRGAALACATAVGLSTAGCGTMMTTAAIEQFQTHLESGDFSGIAAATTERFRENAIPNDSALATFDLLGVPVGELTIDQVNETSPTTQDVLVSVEGSARKLTYHLKKKPDSLGRTKWLVDEITIRQGSKSSAVEKTVSDQMTLLLGVRDVVRAWQRGEPGDLIANAAPALATRLEAIPDAWRSQLASSYFGGVLKSKPRAKLVDGEAEVQLSHKEGQLRLILEQSKSGDESAAPAAGRGWVVKTAVLVGRGKQITRELRREADVLVSTSSFVSAYNASDKNRLKESTSRELYENVLAVADLSQQTFNAADVFASKYEIRFDKRGSELSFPLGDDVAQVSLSSNPKDIDAKLAVDDVTLFRDEQTVRLSAQLLVMPTVLLFVDALNARDVERLRYLTARDWDAPIWSRFSDDRLDVLASIALPQFELNPTNAAEMPVVRFDGPSVEVRQVSGDAIVAYKLSSAARRLVIDDVELIDLNGVTRLKSRLAATRTLDQLADGLLMGDLAAIRNASTEALSRQVWSLSAPEELPPTLDLVPILKGRPQSIDVTETGTTVSMNDGRFVTRVLLTPDGTAVEDVVYLDANGLEEERFTKAVRKFRTQAKR